MDFDDEYEYDTYVHSYPKLRTGRKKRGGKGKEGFYQIQEPKPGGEGTVPTGTSRMSCTLITMSLRRVGEVPVGCRWRRRGTAVSDDGWMLDAPLAHSNQERIQQSS